MWLYFEGPLEQAYDQCGSVNEEETRFFGKNLVSGDLI
jgi:hypothetical protein